MAEWLVLGQSHVSSCGPGTPYIADTIYRMSSSQAHGHKGNTPTVTQTQLPECVFGGGE